MRQNKQKAVPERGVDVSAVASRNDILSDRRGTSDDLRLKIGVSVSISPSDASCARFSRSRFLL